MHAFTLITALAALASARSLNKPSKRTTDDCAPLPLGSGPTPSPDTDDAFLADPDFASAANGATTPDGYDLSFTNLQAASQPCMGYIGYDTLDSYDPSVCAAKCDSTDGCLGFNIYFERHATVSPADACPNPPSTTYIKCSYWGAYLNSDSATNSGQWRNDFHVVVAGSNGYNRHWSPAQISSACNVPTVTVRLLRTNL